MRTRRDKSKFFSLFLLVWPNWSASLKRSVNPSQLTYPTRPYLIILSLTILFSAGDSILWFGGLSFPPPRNISVKFIKNHKFYTSFYIKTSKKFKVSGDFPPPPPEPPLYCLNVTFALYRIIPFQPFTIVVKPAKFYCFNINQQAFNENVADIYEKHNAIEHFYSVSSSTIISSFWKNLFRIARKMIKMQNNL